MKLIFMALGVVGGIFLAMNYPDVAMNIFNNFLVMTDWLASTCSEMMNGIL